MSSIDVLPELLDELVPDAPADQAWDDVLARARALARIDAHGRRRLRPHGRRGYVVAVVAVAALVFAVVAAAYALGHPIVDFDKTPRTSQRTVVDFFGRMTLFPKQGGIGVLPRDARRVAQVEVAGRRRVLWIAPVRGGGFCYVWSGSAGICHTSLTPPGVPPLDVSGIAERAGLPSPVTLFTGSFEAPRTAALLMVFADGTTASVPFIWVTKPIDAGFFVYGVPPGHQLPGHRVVRIVLVDAQNHVLAQEPLTAFVRAPHVERPLRRVRHQLAGYPPLSVPAPAVWSKRRQLVHARADNGTNVGLWIAPARGGGTCYWSNQGSGCPARYGAPQWPKIRRGHGYVSLCCTIWPSVTRIVATFQDGDRATIRPRDGFVIWPIPSRHSAPGHRLKRLVAYDTAGRRVGALPVDPRIRGLYPCATPKDYGYGLTMCP